MNDPALEILTALKYSRLREEDQENAYDALWSAISYAGMYLAEQFEVELHEGPAFIAMLAAGRSQQYEKEASRMLDEQSGEIDPMRAADLQMTAALCSMLCAKMLTPSELSVHAERAQEVLEQLYELDPIAADWHEQQRVRVLKGEMNLPVTAEHGLKRDDSAQLGQ